MGKRTYAPDPKPSQKKRKQDGTFKKQPKRETPPTKARPQKPKPRKR